MFCLQSTGTRRFRDDKPVQVALEESNPHLYNSVQPVPGSHPTSSTNLDSEPKVAYTGIEDVVEPVSLDVSTETTSSPAAVHSIVENSNLEVPEGGLVGEHIQGVPSSVVEGGVCDPPIVEERNPVSPTMEEGKK